MVEQIAIPPQEMEAPAGGKQFAIQVSSFKTLERAQALESRLRDKGYPIFLAMADLPEKGGVWHRVFIGRFSDEKVAEQVALKARQEEHLNAVVVRPLAVEADR